MFVVNLLLRFMNSFIVAHFKVAKKYLRYVKGTFSYGVGSVDDIKSTSGLMSFLLEVEKATNSGTINIAIAVNQANWLRKLLNDLNLRQSEAIEIKVDNQSVVAIAKNSFVDILAKPIGSTRSESLRKNIGVCCIDTNEKF
ncbi:laccase-2-like [Gossypium australe]|uniref:Laccase-2-like n=1 Tax=Gossypium australe TaxID=47621 RepID=A0A5B6WFL7_9ROSI|nr:laccase-2-like [Gossypium australe]